MLSSLAISSLLWLYLLSLFSFSTNPHPTQTHRMCWNKSDPFPWAPWMKDQLCGPHSLLSLPGNSFTIRPWQSKCNTFAVNLMSSAPHPQYSSTHNSCQLTVFYCIPFFSSLCLPCFYKILSFPPFKVLLTPLLWLSITSSLSNPLGSPMFEAILSKKKKKVILLLSPTYNF